MTDNLPQKVDLNIPATANRPGFSLHMSLIYDTVRRYNEIAVLNPATYPELSCAVNAAYRLALNNFRIIQKEIVESKKVYAETKADALFQDYPEFLVDLKTKGLKDCKDIKDSFIAKHEKCKEIQDRLDMLEAFSSLLKDKVDSFIDAERRMKKIKDSYVPTMGKNVYNTGGQ